MSKKPKSRSGTTQTAAERRANGRPVVSLSLPSGSLELADRFARKHGCSRGAVVVMALGALVQVEGLP
jgi:hypothetical protein